MKFMKFLKYCIYFSMFLYCGCSDAAPKENAQTLACPYILSAEKALPPTWITVGSVSTEKLQLRTIGIIYPDLSDIKNRNFSEDIIDDWDYLKDKSQSIAEYDENHENISLKCVYAKFSSEDSDHNVKNVVLLIPLPLKKPVTCLLVRRDVDPTHELSCKVK